MCALEKKVLLESFLEEVAEQLGDITPRVVAHFYRNYPEAKALFEHHGAGKTSQLEASMVDQSLYCLMTWLERPMEIHIILTDTVPHHDVLGIPIKFFRGFLQSVIDVLLAANDNKSAHSLIAQIQQEIEAVINQ